MTRLAVTITVALALTACGEPQDVRPSPPSETQSEPVVESIVMLQCDGVTVVEGKPETTRQTRKVYRVDLTNQTLSIWVPAQSSWFLYEGDVSLDINPAHFVFRRKITEDDYIQNDVMDFDRQLGTIAARLSFAFANGRKNASLFTGRCAKVIEPDTSRAF